MIRVWTLLASLSAIAIAVPAAAQSMQGMDHSTMPGMQQTPSPPPTPVPTAQQAPADMEGMDHESQGEIAPAEKTAASTCLPEHAAMGHCKAEDSDMASPEPMPSPETNDPDCPPEHAAMGHCKPRVMDNKTPVAEMAGATGTDLPAGDAPAPAPPGDWYADRIFANDDMGRSRHAMMEENGGQKIAFISFNLAEYQARKGRDGYRWDGEAWYGGDINRLTVKSEGEGVSGEGIEGTETQLLYSRAVGPYFNAQAGIRQDFGPGPDRTYATIGFEGLAPYWFEVEGALFLSTKGDLLGRLEGYYDQRITQKLILQPMAEFNFALQDVPETGIGSGLSDMELGLRLRYEVVKEFAPYVGVEWARKVGDTARFARLAGEDADSVSFVLGVKAWF